MSGRLGKSYNPELSRRLEPELESYFERAAANRWSPADIPYDRIERDTLTTADLFAVFVTLHIENYSDVYSSQLIERYGDVPLLQDFIRNWEREEENHARALERYLTSLGMSLDELRASYGRVDKGDFPFPADDQAALNVFVFLQELLTRESYVRILEACREPVLRGLLKRVIRDEERHFRFYKRALQIRYELSPDDTLKEFRRMLRTFRMPQTMFAQSAMTREMVRHRQFTLTEILDLARPVVDFLKTPPSARLKRFDRLQALWTSRRAALYLAQSPYVWRHALGSVLSGLRTTRLTRRTRDGDVDVRATLKRLDQLRSTSKATKDKHQ